MLLAVDVGNTRIKYAVFEHDALVELGVWLPEAFPETLPKYLSSHPNVTAIVVASVGKIGADAFRSTNVSVHFIDHTQAFPFENLYTTPSTLGIDRMVLAAGAVLRFPKQDRLVIDAGTCITYDFVDAQDRYHGGAISPGIRLRYEALHRYTAKLPLLERENPKGLIGDSTAQAIHSGVVNGVVAELDGIIDRYRETHPNFIIILTGGDSEFLANRIKNRIFAHSNFLLESLNQTYQYQSRK